MLPVPPVVSNATGAAWAVETYFAALHDPIISRRANSAALAVSEASCTFCFMSNWDFWICRLMALCAGCGGMAASQEPPGATSLPRLLGSPFLGISLITPVASHGVMKGNLGAAASSPWLEPFWAAGVLAEEDAASSEAGLLLDTEVAGVPVGVEVALLASDARGCLRVMPPRSFLIASTSCTPSGGLGFFSLMYRSRCLPREEEVKAWPQ